MTFKRVVITGMGGVYPGLRGSEAIADRLFSNGSCIESWEDLKAYKRVFRSNIAGVVRPEDIGFRPVMSNKLKYHIDTYEDLEGRHPPDFLKGCDLSSLIAVTCADEALKQSGWNQLDIFDAGCYLASGVSNTGIFCSIYHNCLLDSVRTGKLREHMVDRSMAYREAANVSVRFRTGGPLKGVASACATGLDNVIDAARVIACGEQKMMLAGGVEAPDPVVYAAFDAMGVFPRNVVPEKASRPFDEGRSGFVMSSGGAVFCLEELENAVSRGASILAEVTGWANCSDADGDMFSPSFEGQRRLHDSILHKMGGDVPDVVCVHGTSTQAGDPVELFSVIGSYGRKGYKISAPKSQIGHMIGGAGSSSILNSLLMIDRQQVLPCLNSEKLKEGLEPQQTTDCWPGLREPPAAFRHLLPEASMPMDVRTIDVNAFGFGGTNAKIRLSMYEG